MMLCHHNRDIHGCEECRNDKSPLSNVIVVAFACAIVAAVVASMLREQELSHESCNRVWTEEGGVREC